MRSVKKMMATALVFGLLTVSGITAQTNQTGSMPPFVAFFNEALYGFSNDKATRISADTMDTQTEAGRAGIDRTSFVFSPDASKVAYTLYIPSSPLSIVVIDKATGEILPLNLFITDDVGPDLAFSQDSQSLYYRDGLSFYRVVLQADVEPELLFMLTPPEPVGGGGGGGSPYPSDPLYWLERADDDDGNYPVLVETLSGLLYTPPQSFTFRDDNRGLRFYNFETGEDRSIDETVTRVVVNQARTEALGIQTDAESELVIIDLQTFAFETVETEFPPDIATWVGEDIAYSTRTRMGDVDLSLLAPDAREALYDQTGRYADRTPIGIPRYETTIRYWDSRTGEERQLWQDDAWVIGRMMSFETDLYFSQVTGLQSWITQLAQGSAVSRDKSRAETHFYRLRLDGSGVELIATDLRRVTFANIP